MGTVIPSSSFLECHLGLHIIHQFSHWIIEWTSALQNAGVKKMFPLHVLQTFSEVYSVRSPFRGNKIHSIETAYHIVYHNSLSSLQNICSIPNHGSLNPLCTNYNLENCPFCLIAFTLCKCWKCPRLLHTLHVSSPLLEQYFWWCKLSIDHLANMRLLKLHDQTEVLKIDLAQWKATASSIIPETDLTSWFSIFGS